MMETVVGVDLGGTNVRAAAVDCRGRILRKAKKASEVHKGNAAILAQIRSAIRSVSSGLGKIRAVGFGLPGPLNLKTGVVMGAPNLPAWKNYDVKTALESLLGSIPICIENDANAAALGENWVGAGKGMQHMICLTLGTGVGGGIVANGSILHGADGAAGEVGHIIVDPDGAACNCGGAGCLEMYCSATSITKRAETLLFEKQRSRSLRGLAGLKTITPETIYRLALKGDPLSRKILEDAGTHLGIALASLVNLFNPEAIILGGGVARAWKVLIPPAEREMRKRAFKLPAERVRVLPAQLGDNAGILGAARLAFDHAKKNPVKRKSADLSQCGFRRSAPK